MANTNTFIQLPTDLEDLKSTHSPPIQSPAMQAPKQKSLILMLTIGSICGSSLAAILSIMTLISLSKTKAEVMHSYVVDSNNNRLALHQITNPKEKGQHIQSFANWFISGLHSYRWYTEDLNGERSPDPGVAVGEGKKIPTAVYIASLAMQPNAATYYRRQMADVLSQKKLSLKQISYFKPSTNGISPAELISKGKWRIFVKGVQVSVAESGAETLQERYFELVIGEIQPLSLSVTEKDYKDAALAKAVAETSAAGLEVLSIKDIASKYQPDQKTKSTGAK